MPDPVLESRVILVAKSDQDENAIVLIIPDTDLPSEGYLIA
jgi:hypothetical protein